MRNNNFTWSKFDLTKYGMIRDSIRFVNQNYAAWAALYQSIDLGFQYIRLIFTLKLLNVKNKNKRICFEYFPMSERDSLTFDQIFWLTNSSCIC